MGGRPGAIFVVAISIDDSKPEGTLSVAGQVAGQESGQAWLGPPAAADEAHLEWPEVRRQWFERLSCPAARARFQRAGLGDIAGDGAGSEAQLGVHPREGEGVLAAAQARYAELDELAAVLEAAPELRGLRMLSAVEDVADTVAQAARLVLLSPGELLRVGYVLGAAVAVHDGLRWRDDGRGPSASPPYPHLRHALTGLAPQPELAAELARCIAADGPGGEPWITDGASATLADLRGRVRSQRAALQRVAETMLRQAGLSEAFADRYVTERDGRVVLPVKASAVSRSGAPGTIFGLVHDASQTGQTVFVEPQGLIDDNNHLRATTAAVRAEELRILTKLSAAVGQCSAQICASVTALARLDGIAARLALSRALHGVTPTLVEAVAGAPILLPDARHPLMLLRGREVVPNDLILSLGTALIISGPNAGGKTVALKTLGLCLLMARCGIRLPTGAGATIPVVAAVITDVGDDQSIARDLSTFSAHIHHVVRACTAARTHGAAAVVLLDEIAVGTDPEQGSVLAEAIVQDLIEHHATVVVTTHYERLKVLATLQPDLYRNAAVGFDPERLCSTFRLHLGIPGSSSAFVVAERLGVPASILGHARANLDGSRLDVEALLIDVAQLREDLADKQRRLDHELAEVGLTRRRLDALERGELERASAQQAKAHAQASEELRALRVQIREARKRLRSGEASGAQLQGEGAAAERLRQEVQAHAPRAAEAPMARPATLEPGDRVRVGSLAADGTVVAVRGERVTVQLAHLRTTVAMADLQAPSAVPAKPKTEARDRRQSVRDDTIARHFGAEARPVQASFDNVADVRGTRFDEAGDLLESFLARAIADDQDVLIVRHGHGSGALRKAIRERLGQLAHVVRYRPGLHEEGGDAVTVVWVRG